ncbi:hypothetical protein [Variovorax sp. UC122_21]|uniref:hypothetical protein n=1 Tax=Variovorax sp. UC122_21 TaxID=3374554 RepID=UPI0037565BFA
MMQALRGSRATSSSASSMVGWLATKITPGSSRSASRQLASMRIMPVTEARPQKVR